MKSLKIVLLFDLSEDISPEEYNQYWNNPDWKTEKEVRKTLTDLGHTVIPFGIHNDIEPFLKIVKESKPDLVFNMSEAFSGKRDFEPNMTALLQLVGVPFTGAGPMSLQLCKDKGLTKVILDYHGILTPKFIVVKKSKLLPSLKKFQFPAIVKPLQLESSEGISQNSYVENEEEAVIRIKFIHEKLGASAIIEEFIDGREVYVSVLGNEKLHVFPARELFFGQVPEDEPKIATYRIKWDPAYRKKWGIDSGWASNMSDSETKRLREVCKKIYRLLQIQGFGRIDLRIKDNGDIYFIEANPNPSIARKEDYALSANKAGIAYEDLISKIVSLSLNKEAA
jgi:D-alanine-D-alanine ligase